MVKVWLAFWLWGAFCTFLGFLFAAVLTSSTTPEP